MPQNLQSPPPDEHFVRISRAGTRVI